MKVRLLEIAHFRGVPAGRVDFAGDALLVGGNNVGKSTVCEALDLVLGPERLSRRPAIDEHDFFEGRYQDEEGGSKSIDIHVVLTDLSDEARRRFGGHVRRWDESSGAFVEADPATVDRADADSVTWALPLRFRARYDKDEDDFEADTFFDHPLPDPEELTAEDAASLGEGRARFTRQHKRLCGFVFLRTLRTGSRALGLQRGSLLDTIMRLGGDGSAAMWLDTLDRLKTLDPAVGDIPQLKEIRTKLRQRVGKFVNLADGEDSTGFFASDLTREHLREVVRLFVATGPSDHAVPFSRQGTGSINLLVFALLTIIADLKGTKSVIFAMEEPEIALPPHTQRRVTRHVLREMGQTIVTSHSPYVIEQFDPADVVMLDRAPDASLTGTPIDTGGVKPKLYRNERRQFAEAILSKAVIVVEGATEASLLPVASAVLERARPETYTHLDLAGVSIYEADGDGDVPRFGPVFRALGKTPFGLVDQQDKPYGDDAKEQLKSYEAFWESSESGIEKILTKEMPTAPLRRFLDDVCERDDFPSDKASYDSGTTTDGELQDVAFKVLKARKGKGYNYAAMLIEHCEREDELPEFIRVALLEVDRIVASIPDDDGPTDDSALAAKQTEASDSDPL